MKKILLLGLAFAAGIGCSNAQSWGTQIGNTKYDLQTNGATGNRVSKASDGSMAIVWTQALTTTFGDRGSGYVYSTDGSTWSAIPTARIENARTGWPSHAWLGNGGEIVTSHSATSVVNNKRTAKGTGSWSTNTDVTDGANGVWPRAVTNGNYVHLITSSSNGRVVNGVADPILYYRSTDNGATWDITSFFLPGQEAFSGSGADAYTIESRGSVLSVTSSGDLGDPWMLWKSTDNGANWTSRVILPYSVDGRVIANGTDSYGVLVAGSEQTSLIDATGKVHVWSSAYAGSTLNKTDSACTAKPGFGYVGVVDWVLYWNESMDYPIVITGLVPDVDDNGRLVLGDETFNTADGSLYGFSQIGSPASAIDANGNLYLTYFAPTESIFDGTDWFYPTASGDSTGINYRDIYMTVSTDNGATWSNPINVAGIADPNAIDATGGTGFEEECYPMTLRYIGSDNLYHVQFQTDFEPGVNLRTQATVTDNYIMWQSIDRDDLLNAATAAGATFVSTIKDSVALGMTTPGTPCNDRYILGTSNTVKPEVANEKTVSYPNPTTGLFNISVKLTNESSAKVIVRNMFGQEVMNTPSTNLGKGYSTIQLNLSDLANGVYTYTVITSEATYSGRVVKE